jgi:ABC-type branched-subunit amino acid transport system substrate-binding protein
VPEARYHEALLQLRRSDQASRFRGLQKLIELRQEGPGTSLSQDISAQLRQAYFQRLPLPELEQFARQVPTGEKLPVLEALCYRQVGEGEAVAARQRYQAHLDQGGEPSDFLDQLFPLPGKNLPQMWQEPDIIRLALMMPFFFDQTQVRFASDIPEKSIRGLEFYEGFRLGIEAFEASQQKKVFLKILDTQQDTAYTRQQLPALDSLMPQVVIGGVYNSQSMVIADWAKQRKVVQVVPISATAELVDSATYTFLAHPKAETHGARMATYAREQLGLERVFLFTDGGRATEQLASGFAETFLSLGGTIDSLEVPSDYEEDGVEEIPDLVSRIPGRSPGIGVYIPLISNEESASLIVNLLRREDKKVTVMGSPHFYSRYTTLPRDIKEAYQLLFTTSHLVNPENPAYNELYDTYLQRYKLPPSENVIQGYDLARYLLRLLNNYDPSLGLSLDGYFRFAPRYEGIHIDYQFSSQQSNQRVNIGQYTEEGVVRIED